MDNVKSAEVTVNTVDLPIYPGIALADVLLVDDQHKAAAALEALSAETALGFDTESKPTFLKGEASTGPHLVQLASLHRAFLFPVAVTATLPVIRALLENPAILKVGMGLGNDRSVLHSRLGIDLANVLDLGEAMRGDWHRGTVGAKVAVARLFGQRLLKSKKTGTSNWANPKLNERQLLYAANDAQVALKLYHAWMAASHRL